MKTDKRGILANMCKVVLEAVRKAGVVSLVQGCFVPSCTTGMAVEVSSVTDSFSRISIPEVLELGDSVSGRIARAKNTGEFGEEDLGRGEPGGWRDCTKILHVVHQLGLELVKCRSFEVGEHERNLGVFQRAASAAISIYHFGQLSKRPDISD